jgi:site-specific DNA-methyltransferase (adenine-specific)
MDYELYNADCLDVLPTLDPRSVDAVICDPPYGTTACKWDSVIPFAPMWDGIRRVLKPRGACVLFGSQPFTSALVMSNVEDFRYSLVWRKNRIGGFAQAPYRFLEEHEDIAVFSAAHCAHNSRIRMLYNPQGTRGARIYKAVKKACDHRPGRRDDAPYMQTVTNYPRSVLAFGSDFSNLHPTQKPLALLEYLVKTYTNEGDTVLDFAMGSGTTGHACGNLGRRFVGIEMDKGYYDIAAERIATAYAPLRHMQQAAAVE